ncbi:MAG: hypothetical protein DHS20C18_20390 [Saprospiraceae bacterium]|nr:MAG: hypothetical protein DHS20C18_20390 [Saprospiraceae bacterium]
MDTKKYFGVSGLMDLFRRTFDGEAWHGPSIMKVLRAFPVTQVNARVGESHSVIELVEHITAWRKFVIERLRGKKNFELTELENFRPQEGAKDKEWADALAGLEDSQLELLELLQDFPGSELSELVDGRSYPYYVLLHGLIHHDLYHLGQIVLLKKV